MLDSGHGLVHSQTGYEPMKADRCASAQGGSAAHLIASGYGASTAQAK